MYCDCILGTAGFQTGYIPVYVISAVFVVAALAVLAGGWRTERFSELEKAKQQVLRADEWQESVG